MTWLSNNLQDLNLLNLLRIDEATHIWNANLDQPLFIIQGLSKLLSSGEIKRSKRMIFDKDRNRFIVRHGLLRVLLSQYIDLKPDQIQFCYSKNGKPELPGMLNEPNIRFNLSYSEGFCLFAITRGREIGVDIECSGRSLDRDQIINNFFTEKEKYSFHCLNKRQRENAFFKLWTKKEALIKALGIGLSLPLNSFDVSLLDHEIVKLPSVGGLLEKETTWEVKVLNAHTEYLASWAIEV
jgi:4'-phosphopantetheinyl transferase